MGSASVISGAEIKKDTSNTSSTSTKGVMFISDISSPRNRRACLNFLIIWAAVVFAGNGATAAQNNPLFQSFHGLLHETDYIQELLELLQIILQQ